MIVAGQTAAEYARSNKVPIPFRVQHPPTEGHIHRPPLKLLRGLSADEAAAYIVRAMQQAASQQPAFMDSAPRPHFSIGLDAYAQVTSPIRRYPDLLAAYQIKASLRGDTLPFSSLDILQVRTARTRTNGRKWFPSFPNNFRAARDRPFKRSQIICFHHRAICSKFRAARDRPFTNYIFSSRHFFQNFAYHSIRLLSHLSLSPPRPYSRHHDHPCVPPS
jgi:hypothetical protein